MDTTTFREDEPVSCLSWRRPLPAQVQCCTVSVAVFFHLASTLKLRGARGRSGHIGWKCPNNLAINSWSVTHQSDTVLLDAVVQYSQTFTRDPRTLEHTVKRKLRSQLERQEKGKTASVTKVCVWYKEFHKTTIRQPKTFGKTT